MLIATRFWKVERGRINIHSWQVLVVSRRRCGAHSLSTATRILSISWYRLGSTGSGGCWSVWKAHLKSSEERNACPPLVILVRHVYEKPTFPWFQAGHEDRALRRTAHAYIKEIRQQNAVGKDLLVFLEPKSGERDDLFPLICV